MKHTLLNVQKQLNSVKKRRALRHTSLRSVPQLYSRFTRVILLRSDMMLRIVILSYGQLNGEYNITETVRF